MKMLRTWLLLWCLPLLVAAQASTDGLVLTAVGGPDAFALVHAGQAAPLYIDGRDAEVVHLAAASLARDVAAITGVTPALRPATDALAPLAVLVGTLGQSQLLDELVTRGQLAGATLRGQWESFSISVVEQPLGRPGRALVIAGSDRRGTAYGVFELSRRMGVSPWVWWADAPPPRRPELLLTAGHYQAAPPSVKYRGIFLNDEDWGLQPWAAQNVDTAIKDIGPKTYARIFELLLRLRANLIWPAMHPSTHAFFHYPDNPRTAERYAIVVGTSHAEPMLRNNVDEWHAATMGPFDYFTNRPAVYQYWAQRAQEAGKLEAMYSLGMRGVHDSGMQGAKTNREAAQKLAAVVADQREILRQYVASNPATVPQTFTAYKEVLDVYDEGLVLPADVTLAWPDDNYGYISRLSNRAEQARPGGTGVYYHASYWGRPHDYLWLSSTHPRLLWEEMTKAYALRTRQLWVLNVGDIKPLEYITQLFLDMAYETPAFGRPEAVAAHRRQWLTTIFGLGLTADIQAIEQEYDDLAFERRPEFMGWNQTEPETPVRRTAYNHFDYGDEAQHRLDRYAALERRARRLRPALPTELAAAYYELIYYPVRAAALFNRQHLYQDKSFLYAAQHRASAVDYTAFARAAYDSIQLETSYYNQQLAGGKWRGIMSSHPRDLPVFAPPRSPNPAPDSAQGWGVAPEGWAKLPATAAQPLALPAFEPGGPTRYFVDVFLRGQQPVRWRVRSSARWLTLSSRQGTLVAAAGQRQQRLLVAINWARVPVKTAEASATLTLSGAGQTFRVPVRVRPATAAQRTWTGYVEANGYVALPADGYSRLLGTAARQWGRIGAMGRPGAALQAQPLQPDSVASAAAPAAVAEYDFYARTAAAPVVTVFTLPTHELTRGGHQRYGVAIDDGPVQVVDIATVGRSEEWKQNVLRNNAQRQVRLSPLLPGLHCLKITLLDPGVVLDRFTIDLGGLRPAYGAIPETYQGLSPALGVNRQVE